tara:strand:+ start:86 stop:418 length:333 start_codon:yes stop_codon:yes gene_type:complete
MDLSDQNSLDGRTLLPFLFIGSTAGFAVGEIEINKKTNRILLMKQKPYQNYFVTVHYPCDSSSNRRAFDWYEVKARTEKEAFHKARLKAMSRIETTLLHRPSGMPNPHPL